MIRHLTFAAALLAAPAFAQDFEPPAAPSPGEIVAQATPSEWVSIAPEDLLVMTLAPDRDGNERRAVIQLMPPPFSQPWVANIRALAKAQWWDGLAITRVQDNYVVQWGDPEGEDAAKARALPTGIKATKEGEYTSSMPKMRMSFDELWQDFQKHFPEFGERFPETKQIRPELAAAQLRKRFHADPYSDANLIMNGWPVAADLTAGQAWPIHCYGMVGVGRGMSPDAGSGAELYTVIGHAPRHLDRNIAVVGRVVEGIEHLSSLPRGTGPLGFYETAEERVPIASIRLASELPQAEQPRFEYLTTEGETFARYADARANRRDPFFIVPAGGADICNIPVPVRRVAAAK